MVKATATKNWNGNSGTAGVVAGVVEGLAEVLEDEAVVIGVEEEMVAEDVVEAVVEVLEVVEDSSAAGTTDRVELPLLATKISPFPES